ncbi:MAG: PaaI family thioesterase [Pseudomonadota bacterium]
MKDAPASRPEDALRAIIENVPYNRFLQVQVERRGDEITTHLPFQDKIIGNPFLPAIHGGVMGAFLEITAQIQLGWMQIGAETTQDTTDRPLPRIPKTIDITIDYLRSARPKETYARATVQKSGRQVVHIHVNAWQDEILRPVAMLRGNFLMPD